MRTIYLIMFCSICLENKSIFDVNLDNRSDETILQIFKFCVPEVVWDVPFKLCVQCKNEIENCGSFKTLCINSYAFWKNSKENAHSNPVEIIEENLIYAKEELEGCEDTSSSKESSSLDNSILPMNNICNKESCQYCGRIYATEHMLKKHIKICLKNHEDKVLEGARSTIANEIVDADNTRSQITVEQKPACVCTCTLCGTILTNKYLLRRHIQNVHATEKKFKCEICDRSFTSSVYLSAHKRYHTGDRSHTCSSCGKGFITTSDLYHHEKIHANKRAYRCDKCPKAFNTSSDLYKHKICVHMDKSLWKYSCTLCERKFPLKVNLDSHLRAHNGEKNYSCHICNKKCITKFALQNHIQTHTNVMTLNCDLCSHSYKYKKSLVYHMAKAHGIGKVKIPQKPKETCDSEENS